MEGEEIIDLDGDKYGVLIGDPCKTMYQLFPAEEPMDVWHFKVGLNVKKIQF